MTVLFVLYVVVSFGTIQAAMNRANLTSITWAHAVNNQSHLDSVFESDIQFIEADIVLGTIINDTSGLVQPIMGHPPANTSDLTLENFLTEIVAFNLVADADRRKGAKLDFKSIEVFEASLNLLKGLWAGLNFPVWINADIIAGPINSTGTVPVDPSRFLAGCKQLTNSTLSIGWTTRWEKELSGTYTDAQIDEMIRVIRENQIDNSSHPITFPVRAAIAAFSESNLQRLVGAVNKTNDVTLTIWSGTNDEVNVDLLRQLIFSFGLDRVYVDVPEDLSRQLDLGNAPSSAASFVHLGLISILLLFVGSVLSNQFA